MSNSPWISLVSSIRRRRAPDARFFKPVCLIAAIDLANEDLLSPENLDTEAILSRFRSYVSLVFETRAEMGWKPLWHLSNDGLWQFHFHGPESSSRRFSAYKPPGTKAILFDHFEKLVISPRYRKAWKEKAERLVLRRAMLDILVKDDEGCRQFARQLFHADLALHPHHWPSEAEVADALRLSREQLDLFDEDAAAGEIVVVEAERVPIDQYHAAEPVVYAPPPTMEEIEAVASPTASLNSVSEIDLAANPRVDTPGSPASAELLEAPDTQIVQIGVILQSLPGNSPKGLVFALAAYKSELEKRGTRPILGILANQVAIIDAEYNSSDAIDWLPPGLKVALFDFFRCHQLLTTYFPFISEREEVIARIEVDETKATGERLIRPFRVALDMATAAKSAGVATSDVVQFMQELKQGAEVLATLPNDVIVPEIDIRGRGVTFPTPKQRLIGTAIGFLERAYNLLGTSVTLGTATYVAFAQNVAAVLEMLKALMHIR
ncbi:hypothetical protein [Mesorhizobium sp. M0091]|uniref:hypothetical protein n=1 Tax=Mesorhizobium sp. M0091 TaxID=2956875 RepID=UPI0033383593